MRVKGGNHSTSLLNLDVNYEILSPCLLVLDLGTVINKFNTLKNGYIFSSMKVHS